MGVPTQHLRLKLVLGPCFTFTSVASCLIFSQQWHPTMNLVRMKALIARRDTSWTLSRWKSIVLLFKIYVANCVLQKPVTCRLWRCQKICILSTWNGVCTMKRKSRTKSYQERHAADSPIGVLRRFSHWGGKMNLLRSVPTPRLLARLIKNGIRSF